ncbi:16S rRNA (cytidine(1402)-2'-O)-methyltransferase [Azoarcus sp. TTM-91]|uniref:16S rRNA (cytidine(1402)-2'-O)-methyltransferase n=1 Tax=Azoarcus sp. TTM-91 TaxID=2691581 RepID=UPI00145E706B|nr:16S rRNA (cytidine(1402)-2'-O)-methyltransferase [Azoarcus sp. TTM-91]NMG33426.1 16S rRNA (cytidine(1402)-2'-O)-methyltransferase [Azoarcus sp. TTM-91]
MTLPSATGASPLSRTPSLYVVATPLGNLQDITLRALAVLREVGMIAAEDTRHSQRLLDACGIKTRLLALHEHNEQRAATQLIEHLEAGKHIALITDAGTPAVSDPGARAVAQVRAAGHPVVPVPGPSAVAAALSVAGFVAEAGFRFVGFLPAKQAARRAQIASLRDDAAVLVFYEAPHRVCECVADLAAELGAERELLVAREMTKLHEEIARMPLGDAAAWFAADSNRVRGEFVLAVAGAPKREGVHGEAERVLSLLLAELPLKTAAKLAAEITGASRNALYSRALELKQG